ECAVRRWNDELVYHYHPPASKDRPDSSRQDSMPWRTHQDRPSESSASSRTHRTAWCRKVAASASALLDVPKACTPRSDGGCRNVTIGLRSATWMFCGGRMPSVILGGINVRAAANRDSDAPAAAGSSARRATRCDAGATGTDVSTRPSASHSPDSGGAA